MNAPLRLRLTAVAPLALMLTPLAGCLSDGSGGRLDYSVGFYRSFGYNYGAWGPGYFVGPPRPSPLVRTVPFRPRPGGRLGPPPRPLPSIPTRPRRGRPMVVPRTGPPR
jgi:hypothetical protein